MQKGEKAQQGGTSNAMHQRAEARTDNQTQVMDMKRGRTEWEQIENRVACCCDSAGMYLLKVQYVSLPYSLSELIIQLQCCSKEKQLPASLVKVSKTALLLLCLQSAYFIAIPTVYLSLYSFKSLHYKYLIGYI